MKKILMEYPSYDGHNKLFDGGTHIIYPTKLYSFSAGNRSFFLLHYYDDTMKKRCFTILAKSNEAFVKIPLTDYRRFRKVMHKLDLVPASLDILPEHIYLGTTLSPDFLFPMAQSTTFLGEPVFDFHYYYAYSQDNPPIVNDRVYQSRCLETSLISKNQYYHFDKGFLGVKASNLLATEMIKRESLAKMGDDFNVEFLVRVEEGTTEYLPEKKDGTVKMRSVYLIPGIHRYKIYATPCLPSLDSSSVSCRTCMITVPQVVPGSGDGYWDIHDTSGAFKDGFRGELPISFDDEAKGLFLKRY